MRSALVLFAAAMTAPSVAAADSSAKELVERAFDNDLFSTDSARAEIEIEVSRKKEVVRRRTIRAKIRRKGEDTRTFVEFLAPAEVAGSRFLSIQKKGESSEQHIYLPAYRKVRRIVGAQKDTSFMATDFSYSDMEGRDANDAAWKRLDDAEIGGQLCHVLEGAPKEPGKQAYGRTVMWIHQKHMVPMRIDLFAKDKKTLKKRFTVRKLERVKERWLATDSVMATPSEETETRMRLTSIDFDTEIDESELTRSALER